MDFPDELVETLADSGPDAGDAHGDHGDADVADERHPVVVVADHHEQGSEGEEDHAVPNSILDCVTHERGLD